MHFGDVTDRYSTSEIERYHREGHWTDRTLFDELEHQVETRASKVFITDDTTALTYQEVLDRASRVAVALSRLGIGRGQAVAVQLPSWTEFAVLTAAIDRLGAIIVPIQPIYRASEVAHIIATAGVRVAFTANTFRGFDHAAMFAALVESQPSLEHVVSVREPGPARTVFLDELVAGITAEDVATLPPAEHGPDDPFGIVFSSGTTSRAKGCVHTFNTLAASARLQGENYRYSDRDVQFGPSPICHTTGLVTSLILPLVHGASSHVMERWDPELALEHIERLGCTITINASTFLHATLSAFRPADHDLSTMRIWVLAGSPVPRALVERGRRAAPDLTILSLYGRTENVTMTMCSIDDDPERSLTSDGRALRGQEVVIMDSSGAEVPRGTEGEIAYRGSMSILRYAGMPELTEEMFTDDGFSRSGDLGVMDGDGYVRVTGRLKDIVIRGGVNISVREIEDLLAAHDAVEDTAVVAMPDPMMGERACCYLVPAAGHDAMTLDDIRGYLTGKGLAIQKVPERLVVIDQLPTTPTGKVQKNILRDDIARAVACENATTSAADS